MRNLGLDEAQAGIMIAGRNINNLRYADDTIFLAESEELKSLLMIMKEESEKVGLKLNIQFSSVTQSCPALYDSMNYSMQDLRVHHQIPEFAQTHIH